MSRPWPPTIPSWKRPSHLKTEDDASRSRVKRPASSSSSQSVLPQPPEMMDSFEHLSQPRYFVDRRNTFGVQNHFRAPPEPSYSTQALDPSVEYGIDGNYPISQPLPRHPEHPFGFQHPPRHHSAHATPLPWARGGSCFPVPTPADSYYETAPTFRPNPESFTQQNAEYRPTQLHTPDQQVISPPSSKKVVARHDEAYDQNPYPRNFPQPANSSPTTKIGGHQQQQHRRRAAVRTSSDNRDRVVSGHSSINEQQVPYTPRPSLTSQQVQQTPAEVSRPYAHDQGHHVVQTNPQGGGVMTPVVHGIRLISLQQTLPDRFRAIFSYDLFNAVQSKCFPIVYGGTDNVVVSAPTGSGKTTIMELAICKLALDRGNENFKIVYQAPTKALCSEKARDWEKKFAHMNLKCAELTGDTSQAEMYRVGDASIIVTTPEKWDSITRKWQDHKRLLQLVELFLIDEVHILKDARGATLEAVVSRMKTIGASVRFVALSATVPNSDDIAQWLGRNQTNQHLPAHRETFGEEFRPVKLEKFVYGYDFNGNEYMFDNYLDQKIPGLIARHSQKKPILIFCFTRKSCETTAAHLANCASDRPRGDGLWPMPAKRIPVIGRELQEIVKYGVAFHHAGIDQQDRLAVEQSFLKGDLGVICCTSTLAVGVNLPCHTVFLKGTVGFCDDKPQEYSDLEVMQMLGRAGRPQFDDSATAVILTRRENKHRYEKMVSGQEILESTLHLNLIEHLNSEICLGTIHNLQSAKIWLSGTFLSVRLRRNPNYYRLTDSTSNPNQIDDKLAEICERDIKELQVVDLVTNQLSFKCTEYGLAMSRYLVQFTTMKMLLQIPRAAKMESLLTIMSQSTEFKDFRMKTTERTLFREINQSPLIAFPIKEVPTKNWHKVSLMTQTHLGCVQYPDSPEFNKIKRQLGSERRAIFERLNRIVRAVIDCKQHDRDSVGMKNALELARALSAESWEGRASQLTQIPNIGPAGMRKLISKGIRTVLDLANTEPQNIERFLSRQPPFGNTILGILDKFPRLDFDPVVVGHKVRRAQEPAVILEMKATLRYLNRKGLPNWKDRIPSLTFLAESSDGAVAFFWRGNIKKLDSQEGFELKFSVPLLSPSHSVACHFTCEEIVGTNVSKALHHNIPASVFPKPAKNPTANATRKASLGPDFLDDDGINDTELLGLANRTELTRPTSTFTTEPLAEPEYEDFPSIEDLLEMEEAAMESTQPTTKEPVQMPNGKWQCNHSCSGGTLTKTGKPCNHRCCKEGLDRPRKRMTRNKRKASDEQDMAGNFEQEEAQPHDSQHPKNPSHKRKNISQYAAKPTKRNKIGPTQESARDANTKVQQEPPSRNWHGSQAEVGHPKTIGFNPADIECIDLSLSDDEAQFEKLASLGTHKPLDTKATFPHTAPPAVAQPLVGFSPDEDEDCVLLDDLSTTSPAISKHFKSGAKDTMLYEGISKKFDEAKQASQRDEFEVIDGLDDTNSACITGSPMFVERSTTISARPVSTQESGTIDLGDGDGRHNAAPTLKPEEDPQWLSEMQLDTESMEILDSLRRYVTFV